MDSSEGKILFKPLGYHKLLLAVFGALLDGVEGFIAGFIIGCFFDAQWIPVKKPPKTADLRLNYLMLGAFILQTTGIEMKLSPDTIRQRMVKQFGDDYVEKRFLFFRELLHQRIPVEAICDHMRHSVSEKEKLNIIQFLYELTVHSANNYDKLNAAVFYLAQRMQLDEYAVKQIAARFTTRRTSSSGNSNNTNGSYKTNGTKNDHYTTLGLNYNCTYAELKKAYHTLAKKYHPDANPGISTAEKNKLQDKFRLITEAYDSIKMERNWN